MLPSPKSFANNPQHFLTGLNQMIIDDGMITSKLVMTLFYPAFKYALCTHLRVQFLSAYNRSGLSNTREENA